MTTNIRQQKYDNHTTTIHSWEHYTTALLSHPTSQPVDHDITHIQPHPHKPHTAPEQPATSSQRTTESNGNQNCYSHLYTTHSLTSRGSPQQQQSELVCLSTCLSVCLSTTSTCHTHSYQPAWTAQRVDTPPQSRPLLPLLLLCHKHSAQPPQAAKKSLSRSHGGSNRHSGCLCRCCCWEGGCEASIPGSSSTRRRSSQT